MHLQFIWPAILLATGFVLVVPPHLVAQISQPDHVVRFAQPTEDDDNADDDDADDDDTDDDNERVTPVLPRTTVEGQANAFPSRALGDDSVFTPNRRATAAGANATAVTVITGEQIQQSGQTTVNEVLRRTVGVDVVQSGGPGRVTSVFMRGANSEHTKIMIDGVALNDPSNPTRAYDFSSLTVDNIERIEVLRGPQSMVHGSDALGGVINIITKRGQGPLAARSSFMGGSYGTHQEQINVSGGTDRVYYSFTGSYFETAGFSAVHRRFGGTENDLYQNATMSGRFGINVTENINVDYVFRYIDADTDIDGFLADALNRDNHRNQFYQRVQLQMLCLDGLVEQKVGFNFNDSTLVDVLGFTPRFHGQSRQVDYQANLLLTQNNTLSVGADYYAEDGSSTVQPTVKQHLVGTYVQDQFNLYDRSFSTIGVRWDEHSTAGDAQTYRFTQLIDIWETGTAFHGTLGRGFRAPALFQKFGFGGNPALAPEFSKGWDVGMRQQLFSGLFIVDATYFRNDFQNLIVFTGGFPGGMNQNVAAARSSGVELMLEMWLLGNTQMTASYTHTRTKDLATNLDLVRRPRDKATLGLHHYCWDRRANFNLYMLYVGSRIDFDAAFARTRLDDYITVNMSANCRLNDNWELFARVDNLFGENYEEVFSFNVPGTSFYGGARVRLW